MRKERQTNHHTGFRLLMVAALVLASLPAAWADETSGTTAAKKAEEAKATEAKATVAAAGQEAATEAKPRLDISGFAMLDMGYETGQSDPNWFDTARPVKLPAYKDQFGKDGHWFMGVRQSRLGFRGFIPTSLGEIKTIFEFEMFGTGVDAGQTTFRLRHAWGELGEFGAGQYWSNFMDPDVFPNSIEYWGPNGIVWFRNVQVRWTPLSGETTVAIALERPGASADQGVYQDRIELQGVKARFPLPDLTARIRRDGKWGHVQLAGLLRQMRWDDTKVGTPGYNLDLSGKATGWGFDLTTVLNVGQDAFRGSFVYGEGIQNYMNDAPVDVGIQNNFSNAITPIVGKALPLVAISAFFDHTWNAKFTSTIGYSYLDISNSDGQAPVAFKRGHYALTNILYHPAPNCYLGPEIQWVRRENFSDGWRVNDVRIQFSARYDFKASIGGK
jgi:DcaP outer membrane protein